MEKMLKVFMFLGLIAMAECVFFLGVIIFQFAR